MWHVLIGWCKPKDLRPVLIVFILFSLILQNPSNPMQNLILIMLDSQWRSQEFVFEESKKEDMIKIFPNLYYHIHAKYNN